MGDFPKIGSSLGEPGGGGVLSTYGLHSLCGQWGNNFHTGAASGGTWPVNNLALFFPIIVSSPCTVYHMAVEVTTQSGNVDVGIYNEALSLLVSAGSTAVAAAGLQSFNIADTVLAPGLYYLAMACSTTVAAFRRLPHQGTEMRVFGAAQQATALPLPATATFAALAQNYMPGIAAYTRSVTP